MKKTGLHVFVLQEMYKKYLLGGFKPLEKYESAQLDHFPRGKKLKMFETTTQVCIYLLTVYPLNSKLYLLSFKKRDIPPRYCWFGRDHYAKKN